MAKFVAKRLLYMIPVLLGVAFLVFSILALTPGSPGEIILGITASKEDIAALNHEFGYDQPFFTRFFDYIGGIIFHLDLGISYQSREPVINDIIASFPNTFILTVLSMALASVIGVSLGIISAVRQYSALDNICVVVALVFASIPGFWLGLMLMLIFSLQLEWLPSHGVESFASFILPTITVSLGSAASLLRLTRSAMLETIRQEYIRTARAKGASEKIVIIRHALRNALMPVVTTIGTNFGASLGGAIIAEQVFAMQGMGTLITNAIRQKDIPVVMGATLFLAFLFSLIILLTDVLYAFIDPRIKAKYQRGGHHRD
ncbi:MAG TPA: ABC transporter permease [Candidatus Scatomorpha gallistercoris]|nr:ABC transporter permease [Candidatus Scatomorpha gallistercoris]